MTDVKPETLVPINGQHDSSSWLNDVRYRFPIIALLTAVLAVAYLGQWYTHWDLVTVRLSDVYIFRGGGDLVRQGQGLYEHHFWAGYWTYPPFGALVMVPLSIVPLNFLFPLWTTFSLLALLVVVRVSFTALLSRVPDARDRRMSLVGMVVVAVALTPVSNALGMGQLGIIITAMCLLDAVILLQRGSRSTGILVGLATAVKLTPGVFIVYFLLRRQWREAATSTATVVSCWFIAALVAWGDTRTYLQDGIAFRATGQIDMDGIEWMNQSIFGAADRLLDGTGQAALYMLIGLATAGVLMGFAVRLGADDKLLPAATLVGLTSVLCSPIAWLHHGIWVIPAIGVIVGLGTSRSRVLFAATILAGLGVPASVALQGTGTSEWFLVIYFILAAAVIVVSRRSQPAVYALRAGAKPGTPGRENLNAAPDEYFRSAYNPVMYSGAIGVYSNMVHHLMERRLPSAHFPVILELGAGAGQHFRYVRSTYDVYYETDISIERVPADPLDIQSAVRRTYVDAEDLSHFDDSSVDRVIATCLLAHLAKPEQALEEWRRVLRPGGIATIYVPAEPGMLLRLLRRYLVVPKARRLGQDHLAIIYRDHRNHYPAMRTLIESVFLADRVKRIGFPSRILGWNLRLFDIFYVVKGPEPVELALQEETNPRNRST